MRATVPAALASDPALASHRPSQAIPPSDAPDFTSYGGIVPSTSPRCLLSWASGRLDPHGPDCRSGRTTNVITELHVAIAILPSRTARRGSGSSSDGTALAGRQVRRQCPTPAYRVLDEKPELRFPVCGYSGAPKMDPTGHSTPSQRRFTRGHSRGPNPPGSAVLGVRTPSAVTASLRLLDAHWTRSKGDTPTVRFASVRASRSRSENGFCAAAGAASTQCSPASTRRRPRR